jgi:hypothetical protein
MLDVNGPGRKGSGNENRVGASRPVPAGHRSRRLRVHRFHFLERRVGWCILDRRSVVDNGEH